MSATAHNRRRRDEAIKAAAYDEATKAVKGMKKEQLVEMAAELGLEVAEDAKVEDLRTLVGAAHAETIAAAARNKQSAGDAVGYDPTQPMPGSEEAIAAAETDAKAAEQGGEGQ